MFKIFLFLSILILGIASQKLEWCHFTMEIMPNKTMYFSDCSRACFNLSLSVPSASESNCIAYSGHMPGYNFWVDQVSGAKTGWTRSKWVYVVQSYSEEAGCVCIKR